MIIFLLCLYSLLSPTSGLAQTNAIERMQNLQETLVDIKTYYIKTNKNRMVTYSRNGCGIILDTAGLIVTNTHTIWQAPHILAVLHNGEKYPAKVVYVSPTYDFALLRIRAPHPLRTIKWANPALARIGEPIMAIGNAPADDHSIMGGEITSILSHKTKGTREYFEVNLNLYHGDSGGPILTQEGKLLGIIMAKRSSVDKSSLAIAAGEIYEPYLKYRKTMP